MERSKPKIKKIIKLPFFLDKKTCQMIWIFLKIKKNWDFVLDQT